MHKNILIFGHSPAIQFIEINNQYTQLFDKNKYAVTVVYLTGQPDEKIKNKHLADHVIFLNMSKKSVRGLKINAIKQMIQLCRNNHFEIVICHRYKPIYIMLWVSLFYKIPAQFFIMHALETLTSYPRKLLIACLAGRKKNIIFAGVSNAVRDDMRHNLPFIPPERIITLYNTFDAHKIESQLMPRAAAREKLHLHEKDFVFGCIARLSPEKNHRDLITAFAQVKIAAPNTKLILIGEGELETQLKKQASELKLDNDVIFTGFITHASRYLKAVDTFILNSTREGFGLVLLEAMIAKNTIIATRAGGIPEVVGDTGNVIDANNLAQLTKEMLSLYNTSTTELTARGEACYQRAIHYFSLPSFHKIFWQHPIHQYDKEEIK